MNAKARALGLRATHFVRPDGLDVPGHVSSARDVTLLARAAMQNATIRSIVDDRTATIAGRPAAPHVERPARLVPGPDRRQDRSHRRGRVVAGRRRPGDRLRPLRDVAREPDPRAAKHRPRRAPALGPLPLRAGRRRRRDAHVRARRRRLRPEPGRARRAALDRPLRPGVDRTLRERIVAATAVELPVRRGQRLGEVRVYDGARLVASSPLVAARAVEQPGFAERASWYARRTFSNLWP